jgi:hypothetical protein
MKQLLCLSLALSFLHAPLLAQSQPHATLHGVDSAMSASEFKEILSKRGFSCDNANLSEDMIICFEPFSAGNAMQAFMGLSPSLDPILTAAFDRGKMIKDQEANAALEILETSSKAIKPLKFIVRVQSKEQTSIFFSCAVFSSCDHAIDKILQALKAQTQLNEVAVTTLVPTLISDLLADVSNYDEKITPEFMALKNLASFIPTSSPCLYGGGQSDEICVYDGNLLVQLPREAIDASLLAKSKSAVKLSVGVPIRVGLLILKSESSRGGELNFK